MTPLPNCPKWHSECTYDDGTFLVCPERGYE
ncbi:hypothetical protein [Radiobacillus kanasensis]